MIIKIKILIDNANSISLVTEILFQCKSTVISSLSNYQYLRIEIGNNYYACVVYEPLYGLLSISTKRFRGKHLCMTPF